ncbi:hypothetical protein T492DRAFT_842908 [Pavlovales sp. CCMP2436]|nr:hypothetical protein T492DRAFT_842908 [Pavlovales sp. CCMP2436]
MANVFGRLKTTSLTSLETIDSYTTETTSTTELSYTSAEVPQNQTRDIAKIIQKKLPVSSGVVEHVFPFDSTIFDNPLLYVAETVLSPTISTSLTKAVGVQWGFSNSKQIAEGCIFVLGDTKQLETEALLNPQKSTFTVNSIVPSASVSETSFSVTVYKYVPGYTAQRVFTWSSLDTPEIVCTKWKAVMEPYVTFGGTSSSFGHALLNYDRETAWGGNLFTVYYEIYRYTAGDDASKVNLGLYTSPTLNMFWTFSMLKRYFPLVAKPAYSRLGVVVDSKKRISVEVLATGSQGLNRRPIKFDVTSSDIVNNGETYNIVDTLELLNSELLATEAVTILSCTAASDSWIITTDNAHTPFQVLATPAYSPTVIGALSWRTSQSSIYENNGAFIGWKSTDRVDNTYWASGVTTYTSSGVGNQWVQIEFPSAVKMVSHKINPGSALSVGVPKQWTLSGSNNNSSFIDSWQANKTETFITSQSHVAYKYWRVTITLIRTSGAAIHAVLYDLAFNTGWSIGMPSLLTAQPIDLTSFKLVLGNSYGEIIDFTDTPLDWQFNLMLLKNNKIVNSGLYNLSLVNGISKLI